MTDPTPTRRRFHFSLRTLLVVVTLFAVLCSWLVPLLKKSRKESEQRYERAMRTREAWDAIQKVGGEVMAKGTFDHGIDYVVVFKSTSVRDSDLKPLKDIGWISGVSLDGTQITDVGLETVKELEHLTVLRLKNTKVTDAGVKKPQQALPNCEIIR